MERMYSTGDHSSVRIKYFHIASLQSGRSRVHLFGRFTQKQRQDIQLGARGQLSPSSHVKSRFVAGSDRHARLERAAGGVASSACLSQPWSLWERRLSLATTGALRGQCSDMPSPFHLRTSSQRLQNQTPRCPFSSNLLPYPNKRPNSRIVKVPRRHLYPK
jgi:hypothetical protein